ncbi:putative ribonuclease H-like domain-containing protein, partial [Tanacetum coccineum]
MNMVLRTVLTRSGPISVNDARPVNIVQSRTLVNNTRPMKNIINNAYSTTKRPFNKIAATNNSNFTKKVNTVKETRVNTARPKAVISAVNGIENLIDLNMKVIRCDNGNEFKNKVMNQFFEMKGIKWEFIVARTPQQNGVAERKNRTLIEAARTMLADLNLPTTFWADAVNTVCRKPALSFMRPFGCLVTIFNTLDHQRKFDGKADEGFFVGYSTNSKAIRVFNSRTRIVEENLHVKFSKATPNIARSGPNWLFDIDALTKSINYEPVVAGNQSNGNACTKACDDAGKARMETVNDTYYILLPFFTQDPSFSSNSKDSPDAGFKPLGEEEKMDTKNPENENSVVPNT